MLGIFVFCNEAVFVLSRFASNCFVSIRTGSLRTVPFRFVPFRFVSLRTVSLFHGVKQCLEVPTLWWGGVGCYIFPGGGTGCALFRPSTNT